MPSLSLDESKSPVQSKLSPPEQNALSPWTRLAYVATHPIFHLAVIAGLVAFCFARTLTSYFLADDIGEIRYVHQIFNGQPELFWSNFTGNYMQIPSMNVYRPTLLITLVLDYVLWHNNAFGYYLSNILYFFGTAAFLYLIIKKLASNWAPWRAGLTAFFSAALFAVSPLHCESISWIVGRVDSACCFFYLASLFFFLRYQESKHIAQAAIGIAAFWLSITTKEMAVGLPAVLTAIAFFFPQQTPAQTSANFGLFDRLKQAWLFSRPLWLSLILYFGLRQACLGTLLGGYTGSIGASQSANALARWLDLDSLHRFLFPFAQQIFGSTPAYANILTGCYLVLAGIICVRILAFNLPATWLAFTAFWMLTALAPIYRLWGIGYNLEGARFCFFLTMAGSCLLPVLIFAPDNKNKLSGLSSKLCLFGSLCFLVMLCTLARAAQATNLLWVHAGKEVHAVSQAAQRLSTSVQPGSKIVLLGIPKENAGAHMILNGDTLKMLLSKPFVKAACWNAFVTFDPILFSPDRFINATRLRNCLSKTNVYGLFIWDSEKKDFLPMAYENRENEVLPEITTVSISSSKPCCAPSGTDLKIAPLAIKPLSCDYLELTISTENQHLSPLDFSVSWAAANEHKNSSLAKENAQANMILQESNNSTAQYPYRVFVPLSKHWRWFAQKEISSLTLAMPAIQKIVVEKVRLLKNSALSPSLRVIDAEESNTGTYGIKPAITIDCDAKSIPGAAFMEMQVSKTNFFFDNFAVEEQNEALSRTIKIPTNKSPLRFSPQDFLNDPGFTQLRCRALSKEGKAIGPFSDEITIDHR